MRSSQVVRSSDCQWKSRKSPGFNSSQQGSKDFVRFRTCFPVSWGGFPNCSPLKEIDTRHKSHQINFYHWSIRLLRLVMADRIKPITRVSITLKNYVNCSAENQKKWKPGARAIHLCWQKPTTSHPAVPLNKRYSWTPYICCKWVSHCICISPTGRMLSILNIFNHMQRGQGPEIGPCFFITFFRMTKSLRSSYFLRKKLGSLERKLPRLGIGIFLFFFDT